MITEYKNKKVLLIEPMGKPRIMRGEKSKVADRWRKYKADLIWLAKKMDLELPDSNFHVIFYLSPPKSWSEKKRLSSFDEPVKVKPDSDNLIKALFDALFENDAHIWDFRATKLYGLPCRIEILF